MRLILCRIMADLGFETVDAQNGREALARAAHAGPFDVALVDWNMPEMSGYDVLCVLRADVATRGLPVIMVTTETEAAQVRRALAAGASEYVVKPFTKEVIRGKLELLRIGGGSGPFGGAAPVCRLSANLTREQP